MAVDPTDDFQYNTNQSDILAIGRLVASETMWSSALESFVKSGGLCQVSRVPIENRSYPTAKAHGYSSKTYYYLPKMVGLFDSE